MVAVPPASGYALSNIFLLVGKDQLVGPVFQSGIFYKSLMSFHYIMTACIVFTVLIKALLTLYTKYRGSKISDTDRYDFRIGEVHMVLTACAVPGLASLLEANCA